MEMALTCHLRTTRCKRLPQDEGPSDLNPQSKVEIQGRGARRLDQPFESLAISQDVVKTTSQNCQDAI